MVKIRRGFGKKEEPEASGNPRPVVIPRTPEPPSAEPVWTELREVLKKFVDLEAVKKAVEEAEGRVKEAEQRIARLEEEIERLKREREEARAERIKWSEEKAKLKRLLEVLS